jgi:hypothetical protein
LISSAADTLFTNAYLKKSNIFLSRGFSKKKALYASVGAAVESQSFNYGITKTHSKL